MQRLPTNSLERALILLQHIERSPGGFTNAEISRDFGVARSSLSHVLGCLERAGYLSRDPRSRRYKIGLKNVILGRGALREVGVHHSTEAILSRLSLTTGTIAQLGVLAADRIILLHCVDRSSSATSEQRHLCGDADLPVYTSAMGRAVLAEFSEEALREFRNRFPLSRVLARQLADELVDIRIRGYCLMESESPAERTLAVPVAAFHGVSKAVVAVRCRRDIAMWSEPRGISQLVKEAAWEIASSWTSPRPFSGLSNENTPPTRKEYIGSGRPTHRPVASTA